MKAKNFAVTVQYGGGFHNFPFNAYADTEGEAIARAVELNKQLQDGYEARTGRRGVRPRVMVWKQLTVDLGGGSDVELVRLLGSLEGNS